MADKWTHRQEHITHLVFAGVKTTEQERKVVTELMCELEHKMCSTNQQDGFSIFTADPIIQTCCV